MHSHVTERIAWAGDKKCNKSTLWEQRSPDLQERNKNV